MKTVDSSIVIAAFASWHEAHAIARRIVDDQPAAVAHCLIESYSVLTRLPAPHRAPADIVVRFLAECFPGKPLLLPAHAYGRWLSKWSQAGIVGGSVYDALIAATALHFSATLVTLDVRAETLYQRVGVHVQRPS